MPFVKYQHIERFGTAETSRIELGECWIFPKVDGTNASVWMEDGALHAGSRNRELSLDNDNAGFMAWASRNLNILECLSEHPDLRIFGEWLVPHSLKTYRSDAWRRFYVFDVMDGDSYVPYTEYQPILEAHGVDYIPPICRIVNADYERLVEQLAKNVFLIEDGKGSGEGIVIKRYDYRNKYGRQTWAKIVTSEFKEKHAKEMGAPLLAEKPILEIAIADEFVTQALVEKELAKVILDVGEWSSKLIPRLLDTVFYSIVREDAWEIVKRRKFPTIDFKRLRSFSIMRVKALRPDLF
jgi:hypothetical protein